MTFLEKDLEQIIYETPTGVLAQKGLNISGTIKRQLAIPGSGVADLVTFKREMLKTTHGDFPHLLISVYELKKDKVGIETMSQACRYCVGIREYLDRRGFYHPFLFNIYLVGKAVETGPFRFMVGTISNLVVMTYRYTADGIQFIREFQF